jgi:hypothetical protein
LRRIWGPHAIRRSRGVPLTRAVHEITAGPSIKRGVRSQLSLRLLPVSESPRGLRSDGA